jgi:hypothetical protein
VVIACNLDAFALGVERGSGKGPLGFRKHKKIVNLLLYSSIFENEIVK